MLTLEAARSGLLEALCGATYSFNLWHFYKYPLRIVNKMNQTGEKSAQREYAALLLESLLFLLRCEHHNHLAAFDLRREGFDHCQFIQIFSRG